MCAVEKDSVESKGPRATNNTSTPTNTSKHNLSIHSQSQLIKHPKTNKRFFWYHGWQNKWSMSITGALAVAGWALGVIGLITVFSVIFHNETNGMFFFPYTLSTSNSLTSLHSSPQSLRINPTLSKLWKICIINSLPRLIVLALGPGRPMQFEWRHGLLNN